MELPEYSVGLENFEKGVDELKAEIVRLEQEADRAEEDWTYAMELQLEKEKLEKKLEAKKDALYFYQSNSMINIPAIKRSTIQKRVEEERGGLFGMIADALVGTKSELQSVEICDSTEWDIYIKERNDILDRHNREIASYQSQLDKIPSTDVKKIEKIMHHKAEGLSRKRAELLTYEQNFSEKIKKQEELQLRRQKSEINNYVNMLAEEFDSQCKQSFRKNQDAQINVIMELIGGSIRKQIELKQKELDLLEQSLNSAVSERNERIEKIKVEQSEMKVILTTALDIEEDLNSIKVNMITEEKL